MQNEIKNQQNEPPAEASRMVETIFGCKWSFTILHLIEAGINRPGEMVRSSDGLTTKVLNQCLRKYVDFGILDKTIYHELPLRVEYNTTPFGEKFITALDHIRSLQKEFDQV